MVVQDSAARDVALGGSVNVTVGAFQLYAAADADPEALVQQVTAALKGIVVSEAFPPGMSWFLLNLVLSFIFMVTG